MWNALADMVPVTDVDRQRAAGATDDDWRLCLLRVHSTIYSSCPRLCWKKYPDRPMMRVGPRCGLYEMDPQSVLQYIVDLCEGGLIHSYLPDAIYGPADLIGIANEIARCAYILKKKRVRRLAAR